MLLENFHAVRCHIYTARYGGILLCAVPEPVAPLSKAVEFPVLVVDGPPLLNAVEFPVLATEGPPVAPVPAAPVAPVPAAPVAPVPPAPDVLLEGPPELTALVDTEWL
ncbi:MAG: hypothetical protein IKR04_04765 [Clostridia bacterium]|nr:hypothetical protein [Clostridia bacterium]